MWSWFLTLILLISFGLFGYSPSSLVSPEYTPVTTNGIQGYIVPELEAAEIMSWNDAIEGFWTPAPEEIQLAEDAFFAAYAGSRDDRAPVLEGSRQYLGYILAGDRMILVNSFCSEMEGPESGWIEVADGGPCYWQGVFNVDKSEIVSISVNGAA